jgi:bifunctional DNase/RNase
MLQGLEVPRPLTPDLLCTIIDRTGANVDYIVINCLENNIFYASIIFNINWTQMEIDARPSDAIAIALRVRAPIYATKEVLKQEGLPLDQETDKYINML